MGLFTPKWKSINAEKRYQWVEKANPNNPKDFTILTALAKSDDDVGICVKSVEKIENQEAIADIAQSSNESEVRLNATKKLNNQNVLIAIAQNEKEWEIRQLATEKIQDKDVKKQLLFSETNQNILQTITSNFSSKGSLSQEFLLDLLNKAESTYMKSFAVEQIEDELTLLGIVKNNNDSKIREKALLKISDQSELEKIALSYKENVLRIAALKGIHDEKLLADMAINSKHIDVREEAVNKIKRQSLLIDIYNNSENENADIRINIVSKITDKEFLAKIAKNDNDFFIREIAAKNTNEQSVYEYMALHDESHENKSMAISKIKNNEILAEIANNDKLGDLCFEAMRNITDKSFLTPFIENSTDDDLKIELNERIIDIDVTKSITKIKYQQTKDLYLNNSTSITKYNSENKNIYLRTAKLEDAISKEEHQPDIDIYFLKAKNTKASYPYLQLRTGEYSEQTKYGLGLAPYRREIFSKIFSLPPESYGEYLGGVSQVSNYAPPGYEITETYEFDTLIDEIRSGYYQIEKISFAVKP